MQEAFLGAIYEFLLSRVPEPDKLSLHLGAVDPYVQYSRRKFVVQIGIGEVGQPVGLRSGHLVRLQSFRCGREGNPCDVNWLSAGCEFVDLQHPSSLQAIFEWVMDRRWR